MEKEVSSRAILGIIIVVFATTMGIILPISYFVLLVLCAANVTEALVLGTGYLFLIKYTLITGLLGLTLSLIYKDIKKGMLVYICDWFIMLIGGSMGAIAYNLFGCFENMLFVFLLFCGLFVGLLFKVRAEIKKKHRIIKIKPFGFLCILFR